MKEDFLHYLWQYKKVRSLNLKTTCDEVIVISNIGIANHHAGPDFFNAQLTIADQKWAGNLEIHIKSSDWYAHGHENDPAYDNVILHVVWEHDVEVFRKDNTAIPTLELKNYADIELLGKYNELIEKKPLQWINCEKQLSVVPDFVMDNWKERLYLERLEQKGKLIFELLERSANDWEAVLFQLLAKSFGLAVNGEAFLSMANSIEFSVVRKCTDDPLHMEALFFGQAGLLENDIEEPYYSNLSEAYQFLKHKFQLNNTGVLPVQFFRLRPPNFPTIRLSQLAGLYSKKPQLFSKILAQDSIHGFYELFDVYATAFWETHYTFEKTSAKRKKALTKSFIDLVLINTVIPIKFCHAKLEGKSIDNEILEYIDAIQPEQNNIIAKFEDFGVQASSALHTQALIHLKKEYCDSLSCLRCGVGNHLLSNG